MQFAGFTYVLANNYICYFDLFTYNDQVGISSLLVSIVYGDKSHSTLFSILIFYITPTYDSTLFGLGFDGVAVLPKLTEDYC